MGQGAKSKRTPENMALIKEMLEEGCTHRACYGACRVTSQTWYTWIREDPSFSAFVREAEAVAERRIMNEVLAGGPPMAKVILSRRFRQDWAERLQVEHIGEQKLIIEVVERGPTSKDSTPNPTSEAEGD